MTYLGDFRTGKTIRKMWNSNAVAGGSITRATNGTISIYKDGSVTQSTTGVTDTEDFDGLVGVHLVAVDSSSDGTFYSAGSDFEAVLSAASIDGVTINATLFSFSLENRSHLMPTTDGRKLDVSAGGEAGLDWANVGSPTTAVDLSGTTIKTTQKVDVDTIKTNPVVNAGTVTFPTGQTLASTTNITGGTITTVGTLTGHTAQTGDTYALANGTSGFVATKTVADAVKAKTDNLPASPAAVGSAMTLTSGERTSIADALLDRDMSTGTDSGSASVRTPRQALRFLRNKWAVADTTLTVYKEDDTTASWTGVVSTSAGADPVTGNDPA